VGLNGRPKVLAVDDNRANLRLLQAFLSTVDCEVVTACDGEAALAKVELENPDLVLLDVNMPGIDGFEVCRRMKRSPATRLIPVVMITALSGTDDRVRALEAGADDFMTKPVERVELVARVKSALRQKNLYDKLDSAERVIYALAAAVEAKDSYTEAHTERVARLSKQIGATLGLGPDDLDALYRGGLVHDIGKIGIPDSMLLKPGPLDADETTRMREHPLIGERIVRPLNSAVGLLPIIRHHHERVDGKGYPDGLAGDDIPLLARIVSVCDAYDALVSERPYREGLSTESALRVLARGAGSQWDRRLVALLTDLVERQAVDGAA
jgi:putative two-component system response regulator